MKFSDAFPPDPQPSAQDEKNNNEQAKTELKKALFLFPYPAISPQTAEELAPIQEMVDKRISKWLMANPNAKPISSLPEVTPAKPGASCGYLMVTVFYMLDDKSITDRKIIGKSNEEK